MFCASACKICNDDNDENDDNNVDDATETSSNFNQNQATKY